MEKRGSDISVKERAGLTWDRERERDRVLQSRCLSERTEKVVSVGLARGLPGGKAGIKRVGERRSKRGSLVREEEKRETRMLGPDGSERDGISQPEECLSRQRRSSETGLVQSSQISPWEGDFLFAVRVLSRWALRRRAHSALCFHLLFPFFLLPLRTLHPCPPPRSIVSPRACSSSPSRIDVYPRGESVRVRKKER